MTSTSLEALARAIQVLDRLLDPEKGCPWDLKQTPQTAKLYLLEETYELVSAVEDGDTAGVREELGDVLFMLLFLARLYQNRGDFDLAAVADGASDKMISRHPHIFGDGPRLTQSEEVKQQWSRLKRKEKEGSMLAGVPKSLPSLLRAHRLTERAGRVGFDWDKAPSVFESLDLELAELREAVTGGDREESMAEMGDVLFTLANLARHLKFNAEDALRGANERFAARFQYIEAKLAGEGRTPEEATLEEMDKYWDEAKRQGL